MVGWGIGPCDLRASRSGFSRCLGCFTSVFPSVFSMATVSRLLQPGHLHSYGQTLRLGASREELHILEILQAIVQGSPAWRAWGWWGFPAASVSCSAIMHRTPLNRNPWNRSLPQNKHHSYSRISLSSPPWSGSYAHVSSRW
jgi:hypothetical protein